MADLSYRKKRAKNFSEGEKMQGLLLLRENNFNIGHTANMLGISYNTLKNWKKELGVKVETDYVKADSIVDTNNKELIRQDIKARHAQFVQEVYDAKDMALGRLKTLILTEKRTDSVVNALRLLHDMSPIDVEEAAKDRKTISDFLMALKEEYEDKD